MNNSHNLSDEVLDPIRKTIGQLAIDWSLMEFSLDALITVLYHYFGGKDVEPILPRQFVHKTRFLTKCLDEKLPCLDSSSEKLSKLVSKMGNLSQFRHDVIHGYLSHYDPKTFKVTFVSLDLTPEKDMHIIHERKVTPIKLLDVGKQANDIGSKLTLLTVDLLKASQRPEDLKNFLGGLSW